MSKKRCICHQTTQFVDLVSAWGYYLFLLKNCPWVVLLNPTVSPYKGVTHTHTHTHTHNDSDEVCVLKRYVSALSPHTCKCDVNWKKRGVVCRYKDFNLRYFQIVVLEKTLESPLDSKELKPVNPKGNQPWVYIERTDAEAEAPILWPPDVTCWKRPWYWERLKAKREGGGRGWDG